MDGWGWVSEDWLGKDGLVKREEVDGWVEEKEEVDGWVDEERKGGWMG